MEECGICINPINRDSLLTCFYCNFRMCGNCIVLGVKFNVVSNYGAFFRYYCSTNCFYLLMNNKPTPKWEIEIINNTQSYIYVKLIRNHQEKCWNAIQSSHIAKLVSPYIRINDLGTIICEYLL